MNSAKVLRDSSWLVRILLAMWIVTGVFTFFLLNRLDGIVHGTLYNYGLQFDYSWAIPFWSFERLIFICLGGPIALSVLALAWDFYSGRKRAVLFVRKGNTSSADGRMLSRGTRCKKCGKIFAKPLTTLDSSSGKSRLIDLCPYCNVILDNTERKDDLTRIQIADLDQKTIQNK